MSYSQINQGVAAALDEDSVRRLVLAWYAGTNAHRPVEELTAMLTKDVEMRYPDSPEPLFGHDAFRTWYANVLRLYFDETHTVENWNINVADNQATITVVVRWERRSWTVGAERSDYSAYLSRQRFEIHRFPDTGAVLIAKKIVETFDRTSPIYGGLVTQGSFASMIAIVSANPAASERYYRDYFAFRRARVYMPGPNQVVVLRSGSSLLQIFPAFEPRPQCLDQSSGDSSPYPGGSIAGPLYPGLRKIAFYVEDIAAQIAAMGADADVVGPIREGLIPGSKVAWLHDPDGIVIELIEGYYDDPNPPAN
jgi:glyoxylase I family protein